MRRTEKLDRRAFMRLRTDFSDEESKWTLRVGASRVSPTTTASAAIRELRRLMSELSILTLDGDCWDDVSVVNFGDVGGLLGILAAAPGETPLKLSTLSLLSSLVQDDGVWLAKGEHKLALRELLRSEPTSFGDFRFRGVPEVL